jgi:kinesin family protein C2/C3
MNKELERRYVKEMKLRKRLHNELVDLKGNIRVYCRVRPFISEDGVGVSSQSSTITFDHSDDGVLNVTNKGTVKLFEMEKVFQPTSTQDEVRNSLVTVWFLLLPQIRFLPVRLLTVIGELC